MQFRTIILAALTISVIALGQAKAVETKAESKTEAKTGEFRLGVVDFQKALNSVEEGKTALRFTIKTKTYWLKN
jgi:hypothetical protein